MITDTERQLGRYLNAPGSIIHEFLSLITATSLSQIPGKGEILVYGPADLGGINVPEDGFIYIGLSRGKVINSGQETYFHPYTNQVFAPKHSLKDNETRLEKRSCSGVTISQGMIDSRLVHLVVN